MGKREFYQLDLQSAARREAWQRAADRNGVELSVFVKMVCDQVARFDGGLGEWPGLVVGSLALAPEGEDVGERPALKLVGPPVGPELRDAVREGGRLLAAGLAVEGPPSTFEVSEVWPGALLGRPCPHRREWRRADGWRERCRCGVLL